MTDALAETQRRWDAIRAATPARLFLPRAGSALGTSAVLEFQLAHAEARDAVSEELDVETLLGVLAATELKFIALRSLAADRGAYLSRPDLGRKLDEASRTRLTAAAGSYDLVFVIADGLSARAITAHASALLDAALPLFSPTAWRVAPIVVVEQGRVAIGDEIAQLIGARIVAVLIGERPGLTSPDSLGVYLTYAPYVGCADAERNCLSSIRPEGMSYSDAARRLAYLCSEARRRKLSGIGLKDETPRISSDEAPLPASSSS